MEPSLLVRRMMASNCSGVCSRVRAVMVAFSCCPGIGGHAAELAGGDLGVLGLQRGDHIVGGQMVVVQLGRVQPDAHGVLGAEQLQLAHPFEAADDVLDVGDHVVGQGVAVHGAVFRDEADDHQEVPGGLDHRDALPLHDLGQERHGQLQFVLHLHLGDVRVGAGLEGQVDGDRPGRVAGGRHVDQVVDAVQLLFDDLGDRILHGLGRGARIDGVDGDLRRRDRRILGDRQGLDRQQAGQHDHDGDHPGEDRAIDEKTRHGRAPYKIRKPYLQQRHEGSEKILRIHLQRNPRRYLRFAPCFCGLWRILSGYFFTGAATGAAGCAPKGTALTASPDAPSGALPG